MEVQEITIPVPWGIIAGKAWGDEKDQPVVLLHGHRDNANSFDKLIPLLPKTFYYISIDLPGHGKSTHLPLATLVTFLDFVLSLKLVLDHLNRKHYILLSHSFGAQTSMVFTQMYPSYVIKLIMLDAQAYLPISPARRLKEYKYIIDGYYKMLENNDNPPLYRKEDAVQRMLDSRFSKITKESAEMLIERSLIPAEDGKYKISSAQHLKYMLRPTFTIDYTIGLLKENPITCPHLIIMASDGKLIKRYTNKLKKHFEKNRKCIFRVAKGDHDVHMDDPEKVAPIISKFLLRQFNKL